MPARVRTAERRADSLEDRAADLRSRADKAYDELDQLDSLRTSALERIDRATRSIDTWTRRLGDAQDDYDSYQELLEPLDDYGYDDYDYDAPDLPDYDYDYGGPPTTEDFGTGKGSVGLCNDGTLSDSIGRPGACSHHGGVP
jgi:vacuolar-type H+-ATPase subunit I/STV1